MLARYERPQKQSKVSDCLLENLEITKEFDIQQVINVT